MAKKISFETEFITSKENLIDAKAVLTADWNTNMSAPDRQSWLDNKKYPGDSDGSRTFFDHFLRTFSGSNSNATRFTTVQLAAGTSFTYTDRATRTWTAA